MEASQSSGNNPNNFKILLNIILLIGFVFSMYQVSSYTQNGDVSQEIFWGVNATILAVWLSNFDINDKQ